MRYWDAVKNRFYAVTGKDGAINMSLTGSTATINTKLVDDNGDIIAQPVDLAYHNLTEDTPLPFVSVNNNVEFKNLLNINVDANSFIFLDQEIISFQDVREVYISARAETQHPFTVEIERYYNDTGAAGGLGRGKLISQPSEDGTSYSVGDPVKITSPRGRIIVKNQDVAPHSYDIYVGGLR